MMVLLVEVVGNGGNGTNLPYQWIMRSTASCPRPARSMYPRSRREPHAKSLEEEACCVGVCGDGVEKVQL